MSIDDLKEVLAELRESVRERVKRRHITMFGETDKNNYKKYL